MTSRFPERLLKDHTDRAGSKPAGTLTATALRTGSADGRTLLAHATSGGASSAESLLEQARNEQYDQPAVKGLDPRYLAEFARVVALQNPQPGDRRDGLALFELLLASFGPEHVSGPDQALHVSLALALGFAERAAQLCDQYPDVPADDLACLRVDIANPQFRARPSGPSRSWESALGELFPEPHPKIASDPASDIHPVMHLASAEVHTASTCLVTLIISSPGPTPELAATIRSLAQQSWHDLEILLVDNGPTTTAAADFTPFLDIDPRVRLIHAPASPGSPNAWNAGIRAAAGRLITFQELGWSHPRRIEAQVAALELSPDAVAVTARCLYLSSQLRVNEPGYAPIATDARTLLFRAEVVQEIGFLDSAGIDSATEYATRIAATFGKDKIVNMPGKPYAAMAREANPDTDRPGWLNPARFAYQSAYLRWHQRIKTGEVSPYLPERGGAESPLQQPVVGMSADYDVVYASDWRPYGGPQKSMIEEIRALTNRGLRVGILHLEAWRFMTTQRKPLCAPIQDMITDGIVDHILSDQAATISLLIIRYPLVLQFAPPIAGRLKAGRVIILANQGPHDADGTDQRYVTSTCTAHARKAFGVEPTWVPQGPAIRHVLTQDPGNPTLESFDMPGILDGGEWCLPRTSPGSSIPIIGRHSRDSWVKWPADLPSVLQAYPDDPEFDVRIMGGVTALNKMFSGRQRPPNWLTYGYDEVSVQSFLHQIDFYVYFPHPNWIEAFGRAILEALASGCVTILPHQFEPTFGDAAVYCGLNQVQDVIRSYMQDPAKYLEQSQLAQTRVKQWFSHTAYHDLVLHLIKDVP